MIKTFIRHILMLNLLSLGYEEEEVISNRDAKVSTCIPWLYIRNFVKMRLHVFL